MRKTLLGSGYGFDCRSWHGESEAGHHAGKAEGFSRCFRRVQDHPGRHRQEKSREADPEGLSAARKIYGYDCAMCHGPKGNGKGDLVDSMKLTMHDWREPASLEGKTDGELFFIITKGKER